VANLPYRGGSTFLPLASMPVLFQILASLTHQSFSHIIRKI
jgi:hypothetical protein